MMNDNEKMLNEKELTEVSGGMTQREYDWLVNDAKEKFGSIKGPKVVDEMIESGSLKPVNGKADFEGII